jgi:hypothetical protein
MTKARAHLLAEKLGATIEDDGWAIQLLAPKGMVSGATFCHTSAYPTDEGMKWVWSEIMSHLKQFGFQDCEDLNCGDEHW